MIDIMVTPDWSWTWTDEEPFRVAIRDGICGADVEAAVVEAPGLPEGSADGTPAGATITL